MLKKRWLPIFVAFFTAILLAACGNEDNAKNASSSNPKNDSEEITIKHELGETKVKKNQKKLLSLTSAFLIHWISLVLK